ncbi:preprotein translocase subunit SecA [Candidatus Nomurabacteria bacterium]|nr:preprotein translocase subunit SecA [Candidatus Nomurabacteria bacterium]
MNWFTKIFGDHTSHTIKRLDPHVQAINALENEMKQLSDEALRAKTDEFKQRLDQGQTVDDIMNEAFAVVREAAVRTTGMRHYDVQLIGGMVIHEGAIAEMRTGEGKTLVATLPVYLNALSGKGVHVVTVNDYLARRDAQWMGQVYAFLGMSCSVINDRQSFMYDPGHQEIDEERDEEGSFKIFYDFLRPCTRKEAYHADITYGTNNQFGFDYLRDNTVRHPQQLVQRGHHFAIVDEVDSILIDEARVPLILSTQSNDAEDMYRTFAGVAARMREGEDYTVDEKLRAVEITDEGIEKAEKLLSLDNIYTQENIKLVHHLETAVRAKAVYQRDQDYVVKDGEVVIVDPFTGRMQDGRRWSDGLHQAVEAKEGVTIKAESKTMASITYQNYFKFYDKLSGMTGTGETSEEEFRKVYNLDVVVIPTNKPIARNDEHDLIYQTEEGKFKAIAEKVKELQEKGQPVLVGTVSVEKNELLTAYLKQQGIKHNALNAKNHESEGEVVAQAGIPGAVTIATNMAGRGVDIKLGGPGASKEEEQHIKDLGGLYVIGTERHEARRIDNQLRGRSGRQGDPGETQFYVSMDDNLMRVFGGDKVKSMVQTLQMPEDMPIQNGFITKQLERAQEKIEGFHFDSRKHILAYDDVLSHHREIIYARRKKILFDEDNYIQDVYQQVIESSEEAGSVIAAKREALGDEVFMPAFKDITLQIIDRLWMEHLEVMGDTRQSVNLRAYGQREPIVEYKKESLRLFQELEHTWIDEIASILQRIDVEATLNKSHSQQYAQEPTVAASEKVRDAVTIFKDGESKQVKRKKLQQWLDAGWEERG